MVYERPPRRTVIEERSPVGTIVAVVVILLVLILLWIYFFSGWIDDNQEPDDRPTPAEQQEEPEVRQDIDIQIPGGDLSGVTDQPAVRDQPTGELPGSEDQTGGATQTPTPGG